VIVLVAALALSGVMRFVTAGARTKNVASLGGTSGQASNSVSRLPSFALGLLLGGLRGPLVMVLWTSSESQKNEKNLEDIDTKIELIRLLQPEFDTVHLFQIWNKAYNLSVQMANLPNKYTTILDALEYAQSVNRERPNNVNILFAIGGLYFDKYGDSAEKPYFNPRVRNESLPLETVADPKDPSKQVAITGVRVSFPAGLRQKVEAEALAIGLDGSRYTIRREGVDQLSFVARKRYTDALAQRLGDQIKTEPLIRPDSTGPDRQRVRLDPILGDDFRLLPALTTPRRERPADRDAAAPWDNGAEFQHLAAIKNADGSDFTYPYGVSPFAIGYNYYKQAEYLQDVEKQRHIQLGDRVVSSRPALALAKWTEEEFRRARRFEIQIAGLKIAEEEIDNELPTASIPLTQPFPHTPLTDEAIFGLRRSAQVTSAATVEYQGHLKRYDDVLTYQSHIDWMRCLSHYPLADALYLQALIEPDAAKKRELAEQAKAEYAAARDAFIGSVLKYFAPDDVAEKVYPTQQTPRGPQRYTRGDIGTLPVEQQRDVFGKLDSVMSSPAMREARSDEYNEYTTYIMRCRRRIEQIDAFLNAGPIPPAATGTAVAPTTGAATPPTAPPATQPQ
jgi:hypothetical protein